MITDYTTVFHFEAPTEQLTPEAEKQLGAWLEKRVAAEFERMACGRPYLAATLDDRCKCGGWRILHKAGCPAAVWS